MPRARFILVDPSEPRLYAVYPPEVNPRAVLPVAQQLSALPGVSAGVVRAPYGSGAHSKAATTVCLEVRSPDGRRLALQKFKALTNPRLPVAIAVLQVQLLFCSCNYLSSRLGDIQFVTGFGPDDDEAFMLRYYAAIKRLKLAELFSRQPHPPYSPVTSALKSMLASLGAFATQIYVQPLPDPNPCTHN